MIATRSQHAQKSVLIVSLFRFNLTKSEAQFQNYCELRNTHHVMFTMHTLNLSVIYLSVCMDTCTVCDP